MKFKNVQNLSWVDKGIPYWRGKPLASYVQDKGMGFPKGYTYKNPQHSEEMKKELDNAFLSLREFKKLNGDFPCYYCGNVLCSCQ